MAEKKISGYPKVLIVGRMAVQERDLRAWGSLIYLIKYAALFTCPAS